MFEHIFLASVTVCCSSRNYAMPSLTTFSMSWPELRWISYESETVLLLPLSLTPDKLWNANHFFQHSSHNYTNHKMAVHITIVQISFDSQILTLRPRTCVHSLSYTSRYKHVLWLAFASGTWSKISHTNHITIITKIGRSNRLVKIKRNGEQCPLEQGL